MQDNEDLLANKFIGLSHLPVLHLRALICQSVGWDVTTWICSSAMWVCPALFFVRRHRWVSVFRGIRPGSRWRESVTFTLEQQFVKRRHRKLNVLQSQMSAARSFVSVVSVSVSLISRTVTVLTVQLCLFFHCLLTCIELGKTLLPLYWTWEFSQAICERIRDASWLNNIQIHVYLYLTYFTSVVTVRASHWSVVHSRQCVELVVNKNLKKTSCTVNYWSDIIGLKNCEKFVEAVLHDPSRCPMRQPTCCLSYLVDPSVTAFNDSLLTFYITLLDASIWMHLLVGRRCQPTLLGAKMMTDLTTLADVDRLCNVALIQLCFVFFSNGFCHRDCNKWSAFGWLAALMPIETPAAENIAHLEGPLIGAIKIALLDGSCGVVCARHLTVLGGLVLCYVVCFSFFTFCFTDDVLVLHFECTSRLWF